MIFASRRDRAGRVFGVLVLLGGLLAFSGCGDDETASPPGTSAASSASSSSGGGEGQGGNGQGGNNQGGNNQGGAGQGGQGGGGGGAACTDGDSRDCYSGDPATEGVGVCKKGSQSCAGGNWGPCTGLVLPQAESCDGLDNNCDGQVDEGDPGGGGACTTGLPGECGDGTESCTNGGIVCNSNVMPSAESCDGLDNNCDGQVDEGNPGGGAACATGLLGICGPGTMNCAGGQLLCLPDAGPAPMEICGNMLDDDCDGMLDDGCIVCGNGVVEAGEQCDDGNTVDGDGCSALCQIEAIACAHDKCEEGNPLDAACDPCVAQICAGDAFCCDTSWDTLCVSEVGSVCGFSCAVCGNGVLEGAEQCDDGNTVDGDGCSALCVIESVCGNGALEGAEQCDDGNTADGDGCSAACQLETCAHGICLSGTALNPAYCDPCVGQICAQDAFCCSTSWDATCVGEVGSVCGIACPVCGNGVLEGTEQCDDGNNVNGDGCSASCTLEDVCGDGVLGGSEQCDDGNVLDGDGCSNYCTLEGCAHDVCITGTALTQGCNACVDAICAADPSCCNSAWDGQCIGAISSTCGLECGAGPVCGNGVLQAPEQCDDGNTVNGDGCSATCTLQGPCGDGMLELTEQCDDGNNVNGDGCSGYCTLEGCAHDICVADIALTQGCNPCVDVICAADIYCCSVEWDAVCVGEVATACGYLSCP